MTIFGKYNGNKVSLVPYVKHNGTVKIPVSGWTKQNGVLEQVWERGLYVNTNITDQQFKGYSGAQKVLIGTGVETIGERAFDTSTISHIIFIPPSRLTTIPGGFVRGAPLQNITIPSSVTELGDNAFTNAYQLSSVRFSDDSNLTTIGAYVFNLCYSLQEFTVPASVSSIGDFVFIQSRVSSVTFKGTPTSIGQAALGGVDDLRNVYVPWSENEVAGAPWGAQFATIHYNYSV